VVARVVPHLLVSPSVKRKISLSISSVVGATRGSPRLPLGLAPGSSPRCLCAYPVVSPLTVAAEAESPVLERHRSLALRWRLPSSLVSLD
jgi:hypothetical protein